MFHSFHLLQVLPEHFTLCKSMENEGGKGSGLLIFDDLIFYLLLRESLQNARMSVHAPEVEITRVQAIPRGVASSFHVALCLLNLPVN